MGHNVDYLGNGFHGNSYWANTRIILAMVSMAIVVMEWIPNN